MLLLALTVCTAFLFQGTRGLYETTEGRYAEVSREMVATGDWMVPHLDGHEHWTKPPLTYWSIALGLETVGRNTWGARVFASVAFVIATLTVVALGSVVWDRATGLLAGLMYTTSPFPVMGANVVSPDILLSMFELLAVLCFWRAQRAPSPGASNRWMTGVWMGFGLAFLTKGPPRLLPLLAIITFVIVRRRRGLPTPRLVQPLGVLLFLAIGLGWYAAVIARDRALLPYFLGEEVWGRVATSMHHRNHRWYMPAVIFIPPLLIGAGAWLVVAIRDLRAWTAGAGWRVRFRDGLRGSEGLFLVLWFCLPLAVFCLSKSRLPLYVLPLFPAQVLLLARVAVRARGADASLRRGLRVALASAVVLIALKGVAALVPSSQNMAQLVAHVRAFGPVDRVTVVDHAGLHGLEFYLDGNMERVTAADLKGALRDAESYLAAEAGGNFVFVTKHREPPLLQLYAEGWIGCEVEETADGRYQLWQLHSHPHVQTTFRKR